MQSVRPVRWVGIATLIVLLTVGGCRGQTDRAPVQSIEVIGFGLLDIEDSTKGIDATSSVGADLAHARKISISRQTDRVPLRLGLSYGIAFVVHGAAPGGMVDIQVVLRSTSPCVLKQTGEPVYRNDTILHVKFEEVRYVGATIATPEDSHCKNVPGLGIETFELRYRDRKFAEKTFELVPETVN